MHQGQRHSGSNTFNHVAHEEDSMNYIETYLPAQGHLRSNEETRKKGLGVYAQGQHSKSPNFSNQRTRPYPIIIRSIKYQIIVHH